jgi:hypothetical protein
VQKKHIVNTLLCLLAGLIASAFNTTVAFAQDANTWCNQNGQYHPCNLDKALISRDLPSHSGRTCADRERQR